MKDDVPEGCKDCGSTELHPEHYWHADGWNWLCDGVTPPPTFHWARTTTDAYAGKPACGQLLMTGQMVHLMLEAVSCGPCLMTATREGKKP